MAPKREATKFIETYRALKRALDAYSAQAYAGLDLGTTQGHFVRHLGQQPRCSQAELSRATGADPALTGRVLRSLIERGWVVRTRSEEDRREYLLELTPAGRRLLKRLELVREKLVASVVEPLETRDLEDFERITGKLVAAFRR